MTAPERTRDQRMEALTVANSIRTQRAVLKRDLKAGKVKLHDVLLSPPGYVRTAKVIDLLPAVPHFGRVKTDRVMKVCGINPSKTVEGLTGRQRTELCALLRR